MQVSIVTPADCLPCSVDFALMQLAAFTDSVHLVDFYVRAAVAACEEYTGRIFVQQTFKLTLAGWPGTEQSYGINRPAPVFKDAGGLKLPRSPLVAINSVKYYPNGGGAQTTWASDNYTSNLLTLPGRLVVNEGVDLPDVACRADAIEIEFVAGHGTKQHQMPANYLMGMFQLARHFIDNPGAVDMEGNVRRMPYSYQTIMRSQRI